VRNAALFVSRFLPLVIFVGIASPASTLSAGVNVWTTNGPNGVIIWALAIDPANPATVYAGTNGGGGFKSTNGGGSWTAINDTQMGAVKSYTNPQGTPFEPIQDTNAFATCP